MTDLSMLAFECRYFPVSEIPEYADVTRADVEAWEAERKRQRSESGRVYGTRIWPGLVDLKTGEWQDIREVRAMSGPHEGTRFRVSSWPKRPDFLIEVAFAWDIVNQRRGGLWKGWT